MATLTIKSQLSGFKLVDRITTVLPKAIEGASRFDQAPAYAGLEAMAQLAALHVRSINQFNRHAFLLKATRCRLPRQSHLDGSFMLTARIHSQSSDTYAYEAEAQGPEGEIMSADLLVGTKAFDDQFRKEILQTHYRDLFNLLLSRSEL